MSVTSSSVISFQEISDISNVPKITEKKPEAGDDAPQDEQVSGSGFWGQLDKNQNLNRGGRHA